LLIGYPQGSAVVVVVVCDGQSMVASVGSHRRGKKSVAGDELLEGGDPVV